MLISSVPMLLSDVIMWGRSFVVPLFSIVRCSGLLMKSTDHLFNFRITISWSDSWNWNLHVNMILLCRWSHWHSFDSLDWNTPLILNRIHILFKIFTLFKQVDDIALINYWCKKGFTLDWFHVPVFVSSIFFSSSNFLFFILQS